MVSNANRGVIRVAHIIKAVGVAGAERHLLMLLAGLRAHGVDAQILLLVEPDNPVEKFVQAAAERSIPLQRLVIKRDLDSSLMPQIWRHLREFKPHVVHTHLLHADLYGIPAARLSGAKIVVSSRHNDNAFRRKLSMKMLNRSLWGMCSAGIAISDAIRAFCIHVEGASPQKMHTIHYGLEQTISPAERAEGRALVRAELGIDKNTPVVGMVCRLIEQKGVSYGLQAFAQIVERFPAARLVVAGDGDLRAQLEAEAEALGLGDRIQWLGWRDDVLPVLAALDILLMPSLWEGFGLVMLEAMAQRVPIIGSRVSAIPEVVADGETGILVPPRDVAGLAGALTTLLADEPLRLHLGMCGEDRLEEHFSAGRMVDETLALYRSLMK
jgi:glycosyltransferase involved in cell wall biosynthesis